MSQEYRDVQAKEYKGVTIGYFDESDLFKWRMTIEGEQEFAGGKFIVELDFSDNFPFQAPKIKFITKVYHPNVSKEGGICTQALEAGWVPTKSACDVVDFVLTTFRHPSDENPQEVDIANHYKSNKTTWGAKAAEWV